MLVRSTIAAFLALSVGTAVRAETDAPVIPLRAASGPMVAIDGRVDNQDGLFLFDSGWGLSAVTPEMGKRIGCKPWGQVTGFRAIGERLDHKQCQPITIDASGQQLSLPTVMLIDLNGLMRPGSPGFAGAIGLDAFAGKTITIRSKARQIVVETPASLAVRTAHATPIPIRLQREMSGASLTAYVGVPTKSGELWMLLDTANYGGTMIGRHAAPLLGLDPAKAHGQSLTLPIIRGIDFKGPVQVLDLIMDGNLGNDFLSEWDLTLDLSKGRGWLAPATAS